MQGTDTLGTSYVIENVTDFLIGGLAPGTYDVVFDPGELSTLLPKTIQGVPERPRKGRTAYAFILSLPVSSLILFFEGVASPTPLIK